MSNFFTDRFDALAVALDRRIDNELNAEFQPSPGSAQSGDVYVKTEESERGRTKQAGTGARVVSAIPNSILFGGIALAGAAVVWRLVK